MKEINAINTKQQFVVRNRNMKAKAKMKYRKCVLLHCKRSKYSVHKRESYCFLGVKYVWTRSRIWGYNNGN